MRRDGGHRFPALFAPVLRQKENHRLRKGHDQHLKQVLELIDRSNPRQRALTIGAQHDIIRQVNTDRDHILTHQRNGQHRKGPVKDFSFKSFFCHGAVFLNLHL